MVKTKLNLRQIIGEGDGKYFISDKGEVFHKKGILFKEGNKILLF